MVELKPFSQLEMDTTKKVFPLSFVVSRLFSYLCRQKSKAISMKYKFQVMVALAYENKGIEVEVDLSDEEVAKIKQYVAESVISAVKKNEENYSPEPSLLLILEEKDKDLFGKFWRDVIYPHVFVMFLIDGIKNGDIEKYEEDDFDYENRDDFDDICDMYSDDIQLEHSSSCICRIPDWAKEK
jgi:hypothetical protein